MEFEILSKQSLDIAIKIQHDIFPLEKWKRRPKRNN
jgi:hypothetical protein